MLYVKCPSCHFNTPATRRICNICGRTWKAENEPVADTVVPQRLVTEEPAAGSSKKTLTTAGDGQPMGVRAWLHDLFRGEQPST